jgi:hypothetical protein
MTSLMNVQSKIIEKLNYAHTKATCEIKKNKFHITYAHSMGDVNYFNITIDKTKDSIKIIGYHLYSDYDVNEKSVVDVHFDSKLNIIKSNILEDNLIMYKLIQIIKCL